jgi:hypothetical protein
MVTPNPVPVADLSPQSAGARQLHWTAHRPDKRLQRTELATAQQTAQLDSETMKSLPLLRRGLIGVLITVFRINLCGDLLLKRGAGG